MMDLLKMSGFKRVETALDGQQAWEILQDSENCFDLVLMEIDLPIMGGLELLKKIREDAHFINIPVIMVSACEEAEVIS
jgi:CheY-like chemotaxis protein